MTRCFKGPWPHDFAVEDETGAYCEEHGVTLLRHGLSITGDDLDTALTSCEPCLYAALFDGPHRCRGTAAHAVTGHDTEADETRPCPCSCRGNAGPT